MNLQVTPGTPYSEFHLINIKSMEFAMLQSAFVDYYQRIMELPEEQADAEFKQRTKEMYEIIMNFKK